MSGPETVRPLVGLFVTCLVDLLRPSVGFAAASLIERAGCDVLVPAGQTCCGQPAHNAGDRRLSAELARQTITAFEHCDYVVAPSGSCAGMLKRHYPSVLDDDERWRGRAAAFAEKVHELTAFLVDVRRVEQFSAIRQATCTYHDSCCGLREMQLEAQPRRLLARVAGLKLVEMPDGAVCCGFGGTFATKHADISAAIVDRKCHSAAETGADLVLGSDLGCLMNIAGRLSRSGANIEVRHIAEVVAGDVTSLPIIAS